MAESLARSCRAGTCVASRNLGEPQRALFDYFADVVTVREETYPDAHAATRCCCRSVATTRDMPPDSAGRSVWEGHRRGDDTERFVLFTRSRHAVQS